MWDKISSYISKNSHLKNKLLRRWNQYHNSLLQYWRRGVFFLLLFEFGSWFQIPAVKIFACLYLWWWHMCAHVKYIIYTFLRYFSTLEVYSAYSPLYGDSIIITAGKIIDSIITRYTCESGKVLISDESSLFRSSTSICSRLSPSLFRYDSIILQQTRSKEFIKTV